ncbi:MULTISPECIES: DUF6008 family protein [unclassified Amycolatopsis]|uniref:DUF6008 family protein n=1 Tax=unclassified Amycolatopsis TaxID=2618356 RepID=UPI002E0D8922|nr:MULTISPECIES: DUF6008 family protein [unclassified Amycolatopsis]WSJ80652.1 DUF6008 family protein [Amycolatopsis sp. NBC_01307]WSK75910.1 DUF6008 family protein [Amycolatopsis sp. NBC_01286]
MTMPMSSMSGWDTAGAILIVLWALAMWAAVGVLAYANRGPVRPWVYRGSVALIGVGVIGQLGHLQEHVAQVGYWLGHPNSPSWMTPWGTGLANGLQMVLPNRPTFGMELLHLTGNFIFLAGLAGVMVITRRATKTQAHRWGKMGVWMQGIHGLEHLALTVSVAFGSRAIGLSTFFGLIDPGPGLTTYRVWWHFIANVIGTVIFGLALYHLWKERRAVRATYSLRPAPVLTEQAA